MAPPGDTVQAVLADVQAVLDRVRQALPTEPARAQLIQAALPSPLHGAIEYVSKSDRQSAYWRRSRDRSTPSALSDAELRRRYAFIEAATAASGDEDVVELADGRRVSWSAVELGDPLRGRDFSEGHTVDEDKGLELFQRIVEQRFL